jgi:hypothetical protein
MAGERQIEPQSYAISARQHTHGHPCSGKVSLQEFLYFNDHDLVLNFK